jgi:hypothetical protein
LELIKSDGIVRESQEFQGGLCPGYYQEDVVTKSIILHPIGTRVFAGKMIHIWVFGDQYKEFPHLSTYVPSDHL